MSSSDRVKRKRGEPSVQQEGKLESKYTKGETFDSNQGAQQITAEPGYSSHAGFMQLNRTIGNKAVGHFIQAKFLKEENEEFNTATTSNKTGLPDRVKRRMESAFQSDFSDVKVHANSRSAEKLNALAYTQGHDIHFAPGQFNPHTTVGQQLLGHELTHVVQQRQGRVKPTIQLNDGKNVNDDEVLEQEADSIGSKALDKSSQIPLSLVSQQSSNLKQVVQRKRQTVKIIWGVTHVVERKGRSLFRQDDIRFSDAELDPSVGELTAGEQIDINNKITFISRRGPKQEDPDNRGYDQKKAPRIKWFKVLRLKGEDVSGNNLYVRNGTFVPVGRDKRSIRERVKAALTLATKDLNKNLIMNSLRAHFATYRESFHEVTKREEFVEALLEEIRQKQHEKWVKATKIKTVNSADWSGSPEQLALWDVRHYTNKAMVQLGNPWRGLSGDQDTGLFEIADVSPPFPTILSTITLETLAPSSSGTLGAGSRIMVTMRNRNERSGHTTVSDWSKIGNIGDTFYALFYNGRPVSGGKPPAFISNALYYAVWTLDQFGVGWASADWLSAVSGSRSGDRVPEEMPRKGLMKDIIADIFPEARTRGAETEDESYQDRNSRQYRELRFGNMSNFEIKKHGPLRVQQWVGTNNLHSLTNLYVVDPVRKIFIKKQ